jgi:lysophospholipase L1-like esterase
MKLLLFTTLCMVMVNTILALPLAGSYCTTWSASQYSSINNMPPVNLKGHSLRQIVRTTLDGDHLRFHFSNFVDSNPLELLSVHVALSAGQGTGKIISETDTVITFDGSESVTIPGNGDVVSDTIDFSIAPLTEIAVTIYFGEVPEVWTGHPGARTFSYIEEGNVVDKEAFTHDNKTDHWYSLAAIDVYTEKECGAIVCFGDSITDGRGTITDKQNRWSDILADRVYNVPELQKYAVLNTGIGGSSMAGTTYDLVWPTGQARFEKDILSLSGVKYIVMIYGINDIIYSSNPSSAKIIDAYKDVIKRSHENGIKVIGGTVLPFGLHQNWTEEKEQMRVDINNFIMNATVEEGGFDGHVDFATAMQDPENSLYLNKEWNFEDDGLHPNHIGYEVIGSEIDLDLFSDEINSDDEIDVDVDATDAAEVDSADEDSADEY